MRKTKKSIEELGSDAEAALVAEKDNLPSDMPSKRKLLQFFSVEWAIWKHCPRLRAHPTARASLAALLREEVRTNTYHTKKLRAICGKGVDHETLRHEFRQIVSSRHREWAQTLASIGVRHAGRQA